MSCVRCSFRLKLFPKKFPRISLRIWFTYMTELRRFFGPKPFHECNSKVFLHRLHFYMCVSHIYKICNNFLKICNNFFSSLIFKSSFKILKKVEALQSLQAREMIQRNTRIPIACKFFCCLFYFMYSYQDKLKFFGL